MCEHRAKAYIGAFVLMGEPPVTKRLGECGRCGREFYETFPDVKLGEPLQSVDPDIVRRQELMRAAWRMRDKR